MSAVEEKLESGDSEVAVLSNLDDLSEFKLDKILFNNTNRKTICMQGTFNGNNDIGLVLLEKTAFSQDQFVENCEYFDKKCVLKKLFDNDIYGNYQYFPTVDLNAIKATIIYPADEKHIRKFTVQNIYIVDETPELYKEVVLPHLSQEQFELQEIHKMKSLFMEIRPRLQSVNVFAHFDNEIGDNVDITLENQHFTVSTKAGHSKIDVFNFRIVKNSLGCLKVKNKTVSFRFLTENSSSQRGSSKVEFIQLPKSNYVLNSTFLKQNLSYDLLCFKCNHAFSQNVKFGRVLPLPENGMNDFFCHPPEELQKTLVPKVNDLFYFDCFGHVNEGILNCQVDQGSNLLCQNCSEWIGTRLNSGVYKIWFNTVIFVNGDNRNVSTPIDDVIKSIKFTLENNKFSYLRKLLINCKESEKFVLLWVLEDKLQLKTLTFEGEISKVLFKFEDNKSELVNKWSKDSSVYELDVSKSMFGDLLNHLQQMNSCMPDDFKQSNGFNVSYLGKM